MFGFRHHKGLISIKLQCDLMLNGETKVQKHRQLQIAWFYKKAHHTQVFQRSSGFFLFPLEGPKCK